MGEERFDTRETEKHREDLVYGREGRNGNRVQLREEIEPILKGERWGEKPNREGERGDRGWNRGECRREIDPNGGEE